MQSRLPILKSIVEHGKTYYRESFTKDEGKYFPLHRFNAQVAKNAINTMCKAYYISEPLKAKLLAYAWEKA